MCICQNVLFVLNVRKLFFILHNCSLVTIVLHYQILQSRIWIVWLSLILLWRFYNLAYHLAFHYEKISQIVDFLVHLYLHMAKCSEHSPPLHFLSPFCPQSHCSHSLHLEPLTSCFLIYSSSNQESHLFIGTFWRKYSPDLWLINFKKCVPV